MSRNPRFTKLLNDMQKLHDKKNNDYASDDNPYSNFEFAAQFAGITVDQIFDALIGVKQARLIELTTKNKKPNNEAIQDTRIDQAVYTALKASYHEELEDAQ